EGERHERHERSRGNRIETTANAVAMDDAVHVPPRVSAVAPRDGEFSRASATRGDSSGRAGCLSGRARADRRRPRGTTVHAARTERSRAEPGAASAHVLTA